MAKNVVLKISQKGAKKTTTALKNVGGALTSIGTKAGIVTAGFGILSVKLAGDFQKSLLEVSTLLDKTNKRTLPEMSRELRNVASASGLALSSISKAKYDIVSAGFSKASDSAKVLNASSKLAVGGVTSAAEAADLLTTALNAYGKSAEEVDAVSNTLFTTVRLGKTTMGELAGSLGRVLPFAKSMNLSLDDVGASMATLTAAGINTAEATTALTSAITSLSAPGDAAKEAMELAGVEVKKFDDGTVDLVKTIEQFQGLDQETIKKFIPNIRAIAAIQTMANNFGTLENNVVEFNRAAQESNATEIAFNKMTSAFNTQFAMLRNNFQGIMIEIGNVIIETIQPSIEQANKEFEKLGDIGWDNIGKAIQERLPAIAVLLQETMRIAFEHIEGRASIMGLTIKEHIKDAIPFVEGDFESLKQMSDDLTKKTSENTAELKELYTKAYNGILEKAQENRDAQVEVNKQLLEQQNADLEENEEKKKEIEDASKNKKAEDVAEAIKFISMEQFERNKGIALINKEAEEMKRAGVSEIDVKTFIAKKTVDLERVKRAAQASTVSSLVGALGQANTAFKGSALVSKRLAQVQAVIDTYAGANKALAASPPPFNFVAAAAVVAAGLTNVATIESQNFASGGIVQGAGNQDTVPAMLTPGELILNQAQQENLAGNSGGAITLNISAPLVDETILDTIIPAIEKAKSMNIA
jgi:TP901 family phage tail tape measure protein